MKQDAKRMRRLPRPASHPRISSFQQRQGAPMDDNLLRIFIAVTTFAVVIQAGILVGLYLAVRRSTAKMETLATEFSSKALPTIETAQNMLVNRPPKMKVLSATFAEPTPVLRTQITRVHATVTAILDRTRLQVI